MQSLMRIIVPVKDNTGRQMMAGHTQFRDTIIGVSGGVTEIYVIGHWRGFDGILSSEVGMAYDFTVRTDLELETIKRAFWRLFPDQKALFVAQLGYASIEERPDHA